MATRQIFNANTQQVEDAELAVDSNNEIIATFADGSFLKFPAGLDEGEFAAQIVAVQEANQGQEIITPEMEAQRAQQRAASEALINNSGNTMPEGQQSNATGPSNESVPTI